MGEFSAQVVRRFPAPRERVFQALTTADDLVRWWGPNAEADLDFRVGGAFRLAMDLKDGARLVAFGTYREIQAPERLVMTWAWEGNPQQVTLVTMEIWDRGAETELVLTHAGNPSQEVAETHRTGWNYCLDRLPRVL